jgi:hypothetical protein
MFIRIKFPNKDGEANYLVLSDYQFSRTAQYDSLELSRIFSQNTKLLMILGSLMSFTLSGTAYIKTGAADTYIVEGLYNKFLGSFSFASLPSLFDYFNEVTKSWNDGKNNVKTAGFAIQYVNTHTQSEDPALKFENFIPESFTYSISTREVFAIHINLSGKIGEPITSQS